MKITLIAALAHARVIGSNNTLPWKLSADLRRFKALTTGHTILMGRKTFESLGRPLPQRTHICVSRMYPADTLTPDTRWPEQVFWCGELFSAVQLLKQKHSPTENLFIIGGADIYAQALSLADTLELTHIDAQFAGDAFFPDYENLFACDEEISGEESGLRYSFNRYHSLRPTGIVVRPARPSDADFIARAQSHMALESEQLVLNDESLRQGVAHIFEHSDIGEYLLAERQHAHGENIPVGCLLLQKEWSDWRNGNIEWMHSVYVVPEERRRGIFKWMYRYARARVSTRGSLGLRLYVEKMNRTAQQTYASLGMTDTHYDLFEDLFKK